MRYTESREQSAEILRKVLALMGQHDAAFNPVSYAVWYEHVTGVNARLTQALEQAMGAEPRLGDETLLRLYRDFLAEADAQTVQSISAELQQMMLGMAEGALRTGDQAGSFGEQLRSLTVALKSNDPRAMTPLLTQALVGTTQMRSSAQELEQQVLNGRREIERLRADLTRARDEAVLDPLTRVLNRKGFDEQLASLLAQQPQADRSHCLILFDIDHFKQVNDTHGHVMGDRVIQALGEVLRSSACGKSYAVARYGGEEFAILLPHCTLDYSLRWADAVRQRTRDMKIRDRRTKEVVLSVSISGGVAAMQPGDEAPDLIARADQALYQSKRAGRDRVTCA